MCLKEISSDIQLYDIKANRHICGQKRVDFQCVGIASFLLFKKTFFCKYERKMYDNSDET